MGYPFNLHGQASLDVKFYCARIVNPLFQFMFSNVFFSIKQAVQVRLLVGVHSLVVITSTKQSMVVQVLFLFEEKNEGTNKARATSIRQIRWWCKQCEHGIH